MPGALMQLVAYGAQDVYLTGNPHITFFKVVYRRHTNFATEIIELTLNGNPDFGRKSQVTITRNGDLISEVYLRVAIDQVFARNGAGQFAWVRRLGHALINSVEVEIGGSKIDKQYGRWMDIWWELSHTTSQEVGYNRMIGDVPELTVLSSADANNMVKDAYTMFIPLQFWFCKNTGLALPLIALQYHEVRINFEFTPVERLMVRTNDFVADQPIRMQEASVLVNYTYLDSEERRRFAQAGHEYLIEQVQFTGEEIAQNRSTKVKLNYNHPTKELLWAIVNGNFWPSSSKPHSFLAYSESSDWSRALDAAAVNLAYGMLFLATGPDVGTDGILATDFPIADSSAGTSTPITLTNGQVITVDIATNDPGLTLVLRPAVLTLGNINLVDYVNAITVDISGTDFTDAIITVSIVDANLTLRHLSVPTDLWIDNRTNNQGSSVRTNNTLDNIPNNPNDVLAFFWNNYGLLLDGTGNPVSQALIQLNGHDRFDIREGAYFNYVQPHQHHTRTPAAGINVYSFALHPEQHQPSGTANLSRIDSTFLNINFVDPRLPGDVDLGYLNSDTKLYIFALSYNVLRIMSGMGGLAYSS